MPVPERTDALPPGIARLRVLAFCDWYTPAASGGAERAAWEVYRRLGAAGARIRVVSATHGPPHCDPGVEVNVIRALDLSSLAGGYLAPAPGAFSAARRAAKAFGPNVIHVNTLHYTGCVAGASLARRTGVPLVVTAQLGSMDHIPGLTRRLADAYDHVVGRYILRRATRVLAVSDAARANVEQVGADPADVSIVPNGVDHNRFAMAPIVATAEPLVVAVGRLTANKGPDLLVEAAGRVRDLPFRLAFVGDGPLRAGLAERAGALGIADRVEFTGHVPDVERWIERAEVVVRPSYTEGLSLAVLEAMAAARCNVVSDIAPNRELIVDGVNGLTFRVGDVEDLARALRTAVGDGELRRRLGDRARVDAAPYTWDAMAARHGAALLACADRVGETNPGGSYA